LNSFVLPAATLWQRELVRFWRQKSRVLGVVASPLVFWLLIGYGSNDLARFYSGSLVLTVMFSAVFSTISIIEDRREGFLLSMMVSPAPRTSLVLGKILGSATLAWIQGLIFLAFAPLAGVRVGPVELIPIAAAIFLISFTLTGLGFVIAWRMNSTAGFHAIMNLLLVPMWMVSGSLFPMATAHGWVKAIMWVNPLTYSIALLNHTLKLPNAAPGLAESLIVTVVFGLLLLLASGAMAAQKATRSAA
jgi:ABC-2 type transport system permease protein